MEFVITHRNEDLTAFFIKLKSDFESDSNSRYNGFRPEKFILNKINEGVKFYTYNKKSKKYVDVKVVDENIRSSANNTKVDNLKKLPIFE
jgi:hypothetical protein